jgi:predicted RND superfamily exporter protein
VNRSSQISARVADALDRRSSWFLAAVAAVTLLLIVPMVLMAPDETASDSPGGPVYDLENSFSSRLPSRFHGSFFMVEAKDGDVLTGPVLAELRRNSQALRAADTAGKLHPPGLPDQAYLFNGYDVDRQEPVLGIFTLADAVSLIVDLDDASDEQVKAAVGRVLSDPRFQHMEDFVYGLDRETWTAPAMGVFVAADNEKLGGGTFRIGATGDPATDNKERFNRAVQRVLRSGREQEQEQEHYSLWGVAIDAGLERDDEVGTAVPFIMTTFLMVLVVVGISLRSWRVVLLTAVGLVFMIVWLKGLSNLVGLKSSVTLDFIVPIAMISLGADFVIHAVNRYREESRVLSDPRLAFRVGLAGVIGALALAMVTDAIAFLANATAEIETVIGFGIGAGLAIFAAFIIMGMAIPVALMRLDVMRLRNRVDEPATTSESEHATSVDRWSLADLVVLLARRRLVVLPLTAVLTIISGYYAFQLEATFDVKDFFERNSDFVVGLDKIDEFVGDSVGESAIVYIEGDLADPTALDAISLFVGGLAENPYVAKDDGEARLQARTIFHVLDQVMRSDYATAQIEEATGVLLPGEESPAEFHHENRVFLRPSTREGLEAVYEYITSNGVPASPDQDIYDALQVGETLSLAGSGSDSDATAIVLGVPGTREQARVVVARDALAEEIDRLQEDSSLTLAGLTGSPFTRQAALDATTGGLQKALVVAVVACLLIAVAAMRSIRFGVVTIIPIGLVVAWLYAFMYAFGFGLNFVTATIAAISIGVGIDYAIHMTLRFREELERDGDRVAALGRAANGTGVALLASAATSVIGFAIMAFAPMPMFASYGILTAAMIFMAAAASLVVLPSLLFLVTPGPAGNPVPVGEDRS